jgi:hypothetical protein
MKRTKRKNPHWGSTLEDFLDEEGIREAAKAEAITRVVAWQLAKEMKRQGITKARLAQRMHTSRAQVQRYCRDATAGCGPCRPRTASRTYLSRHTLLRRAASE